MRYIVFDIETQNLFQDVASRDPAALDISVITVYDSGTDRYTTVDISELDTIWPIIEAGDALVGYNSNHFDIPILNKYYPGDLTQMKSIDIMASIQDSFGKRLKLDDVASATVNAKKNANGLIAVKWWKEGNIADIKKYCEQDVRVTKQVFDHAMEHGKVYVKQGTKKIEIPIDTTLWKVREDAPMTHTLMF
ncbi:hypothetical protein A3C87_00215 [Candidatus Kaiserbacteria bacterium RIFCSPHIGHO2_02_FULL_49_34]|uniref:YprB ribonuclease H-like domain-containing protein n=1 Tax=Candidatus Kaiserbacteria bacterium RIFCSPHIGHO2_02_FULL_49_34 TaxID=1798491 RepID=A0A1F6DJ89_9BACT|nr:MAG: hypothetical protein A3C87_00215 [Candidatus Kaiserbacteria bacterium RIFCSPHIGHO2_02_FULL_49_34]